jgi:hypothetical protein
MKNPMLRFSLALAVLAATGCFFGGDDEKATGFAKVSPGFYVADYDAIPKLPNGEPGNWRGLGGEISLSTEGGFRMFWTFDTSLVYELRGKWGQKDFGLYFTDMMEMLLAQPDSMTPVFEADTCEVMDVTANSFIRKEYTPLRQKPYWIKYTKADPPQVKPGTYRLTVEGDSTTPHFTVTINFDGQNFRYQERDTSVAFEFEAKWYQVGTVLATFENRRHFRNDSTGGFGPWDSLTAEILQKVRISDDKVEIWSPPSGLFSGGWTTYSKVVE